MTSLKKAVENLRPQIEAFAKNEGYLEANAKHGEPNQRQDNVKRMQEVRTKYWELRETVVTIFSHMQRETVRKALFDVYYDAWWNAYTAERKVLKHLYSQDEVA